MIIFSYLRAELFRRRSKTFLIAIGLGVPIALVIVIGAYSTGLGKAQDDVLEPLVGLGTDMTVTKPSTPGQGGNQNGGPPRFAFNQREAGEKFSDDNFTTGFNSTINETNVAKISGLSGVSEASGALTVNNIKVSGQIPESTGGNTVMGPGAAGGGGAGGPQSIDVESKSITGISPSSNLGPVSSDQLQKGNLLTNNDAKEALITASYAKSEKLAVGDTVTLKDTDFKVVGIVSNPLAGSSSDVYVKLDQLQKVADMDNKINTVYVRADSQDAVSSVSGEIKSAISGSSVTTNSSLADQVSGSLVDANKLVDKMSVFLQLVLLMAAVVITSILTLNAVNKRTRDLGTLKSIGWANPRLIKQVMAESLSTGLIGAAVGVVLGLVAMAAAQLMPLTMKVTGAATGGGPRFAGGPGGAPPGGGGQMAQGGPPGMARNAAETASQTISIVPSLSVETILIAAAIGAITALVAGGLGSYKTSRLSPVEALKHVD